jgi:hypothetical protein
MRLIIYYLSITVIALGLFSCTSTQSTQERPTPADNSSETSRNEAQLAYELSNKTWCTNDEACSLILLFSEGQDRCANFADRLEKLRALGFVQDHWNLLADEPVTKGTLAYMICRALKVRGGFFMHLIPSRRYAYREAVYMKIMQKGSENEPLTGPEVVGVLGRVARLQQDGIS